MKLQKLEFDLEEVAFAHIAGFVALFADIDGLLKAFEVLLGEVDRGLGEDDVYELLGDVEDELTFVIGNRRTRDRSLIFGGLKAVLAFFAALEGVADAKIELGLVVDVICGEFAGLKDGEELSVPGEDRVGTEIGGRFERLVLEDGGTSRLESVIVLQGEADGLIERDACGGTLGSRCSWERRGYGGSRWVLLSQDADGQGQKRGGQCRHFLHVDTPLGSHATGTGRYS